MGRSFRSGKFRLGTSYFVYGAGVWWIEPDGVNGGVWNSPTWKYSTVPVLGVDSQFVVW